MLLLGGKFIGQLGRCSSYLLFFHCKRHISESICIHVQSYGFYKLIVGPSYTYISGTSLGGLIIPIFIVLFAICKFTNSGQWCKKSAPPKQGPLLKLCFSKMAMSCFMFVFLCWRKTNRKINEKNKKLKNCVFGGVAKRWTSPKMACLENRKTSVANCYRWFQKKRGFSVNISVLAILGI